MTTLALLAAEYRAAAQALADLDMDAQTVADTLDGMSGELEAKAQNVALMVRSLEADAEAIKQWARDAAERAKATQARADRLRQYLADMLGSCGIEKIEGPGVRISWRKSTAVDVFDAAQLPAQYMRQPETPPAVPDKAAIADALKSGSDVPGARLDVRRGLWVR